MQRFSIVALLALVTLASANHDLIAGERRVSDKLMVQKEIHFEAVSYKVRTEYLTVTGNGNDVITYIEIIDLRREENSAKPQIISGGPGKTYASIKLESKQGGPIHFLLQVYGKARY